MLCLQLCGGPDVSGLLIPVQQGAPVERPVPGPRPGAAGTLPQTVFAGEDCCQDIGSFWGWGACTGLISLPAALGDLTARHVMAGKGRGGVQ